MKISVPYISPLVFNPASDPAATELRFTQRFGRYDHVIIQVAGKSYQTLYMKVYNALDGTQVASKRCSCTTLEIGVRYIYTAVLDILDEGIYYAKYTQDGETLRSQDFEVTRLVETDSEWALFEYGGSRNDTPIDTAFVVGGIRVPFLVRLPAGFKPSGYEGSVEVETYRTQTQELRVLYSAPYDKWTLTIGAAQGIPVEYVRMVEWILSCEYVYINGVRWVRSEGSTVEKQLVMQGAQMFTASVVLERQQSLDNYPDEVYLNENEFNDDFNQDFNI